MRSKRKAPSTISTCPCCPPIPKKRKQSAVETDHCEIHESEKQSTIDTEHCEKHASENSNISRSAKSANTNGMNLRNKSQNKKSAKKVMGRSTIAKPVKSREQDNDVSGMLDDHQHGANHILNDHDNNDSDESVSSDDGDDYPLGAAVNEHVKDITIGGNEPMFVEPISTTIQSQIPLKIQKKIWGNKFIDLSVLLPMQEPVHMLEQNKFTFQVDSLNNFKVVPQQRIRKIISIEAWTTAFLRFCAIYALKFPKETPALMKYAEMVRDLARRHAGPAWQTYDTRFRTLRERVTYPWDRIHTEFWLMASVQGQGSNQNFRSFRPNHQGGQYTSQRKRTGQRPHTNKFLDNTCWVYNGRAGNCKYPGCRHPHICGFCRGPHHADACSFSSKEQAATTLQQQHNKLPQSNCQESEVVTPIKIKLLQNYLKGHQHYNYLVEGFSYGFDIGYIGPRRPVECTHLKSCEDFPLFVEQHIRKELSASRLRGPFKFKPFPNTQLSPIGLVKKKTAGQFRFIQNLSHPKSDSFNDYIRPDLSTVKYMSFDDAAALVRKLGPNCYMSKTDIADAFRIIPIRPEDHELLAFKFNGLYYYNVCLVMGSSSSCAIFESFSSAIQWIAQTKLQIPNIVHILDDFMLVGTTQDICKSYLATFLQFCEEVGIPIKSEKTEYPSQVMTFMGLQLDSVTMEARLPEDKLAKLGSLLQQYSKYKKIKLVELQSLLGLLNFCCSVVLPGRCFMRRLTDLTKKVKKPHHRITLTVESRRDIQAWQLFISHFNVRKLLLVYKWITDKNVHLFTDASGSLGYGAMFDSHWLFGSWPTHLAPYQITFKELFPIVISLEIWGSQLANKYLILHSDNEAVVYIINKQTSKEKNVMVLVRRLVLACMRHNILVRASHVPGKLNTLPDLLSRLQINKFKALSTSMDAMPTIVPDHLLDI